jgi:hypothetical protein
MASMLLPRLRRRLATCLGLVLLCAVFLPFDAPSHAQNIQSAPGNNRQIYLPITLRSALCQPLPAQDYVILSADGPGPIIPVEAHPDYNLEVRSYEPANQYLGLVEYSQPHDPLTPQFAGLFTQPRLPRFVATYRVYDWDWGQMRRGPLIADPPVTALGLKTTAEEVLHVPDSGYTIGSGCEVLVIYAATDQITLKYTREDNVVYGYTLHIDHICVDSALLALYKACNDAGRACLPALHPRQPFGRASGDQVVIAIVDTGTFLDARSHRDWWRDY